MDSMLYNLVSIYQPLSSHFTSQFTSTYATYSRYLRYVVFFRSTLFGLFKFWKRLQTYSTFVRTIKTLCSLLMLIFCIKTPQTIEFQNELTLRVYYHNGKKEREKESGFHCFLFRGQSQIATTHHHISLMTAI